ncbi:MAG: Kielin/chordin-like protein [Candidatus Roizmanbacteria bacterium GW2011_GWA2_36_23]|uniref:Kielin/chordin-like protein n=1 Tax=Candidatus Roizmanbacteria bacterium GW2011_GWA2_36_23 TaxID=1618480 RepID=A0A0G0EM06_9BACT|nr:MAG: Kielin/chordin-like protein [Candidatus Roizmanbacteria bacterium GW2011_GWA2_36_23]
MKINKVSLILVILAAFVLGIVAGSKLNGLSFSNNSLDPQTKTCKYNNKEYQTGTSFPAEDNCNTCSCNNGEVACTLIACDTK